MLLPRRSLMVIACIKMGRCVCHTIFKIVIWPNFKGCHGADDAFSFVCLFTYGIKVIEFCARSPAPVSCLKIYAHIMLRKFRIRHMRNSRSGQNNLATSGNNMTFLAIPFLCKLLVIFMQKQISCPKQTLNT